MILVQTESSVTGRSALNRLIATYEGDVSLPMDFTFLTRAENSLLPIFYRKPLPFIDRLAGSLDLSRNAKRPGRSRGPRSGDQRTPGRSRRASPPDLGLADHESPACGGPDEGECAGRCSDIVDRLIRE